MARLAAKDGSCRDIGWLDCLQSVIRVAVDGGCIGSNRWFVSR